MGGSKEPGYEAKIMYTYIWVGIVHIHTKGICEAVAYETRILNHCVSYKHNSKKFVPT